MAPPKGARTARFFCFARGTRNLPSPRAVRFLTKIYHPNVDKLGRICLDILKDKRGPPRGSVSNALSSEPSSRRWSPALQIRTVLLSIQALLSAPNPDDPLDNDVAELWKRDEKEALKKVRETTPPSRALSPRRDRPTPRAGRHLDRDLRHEGRRALKTTDTPPFPPRLLPAAAARAARAPANVLWPPAQILAPDGRPHRRPERRLSKFRVMDTADIEAALGKQGPCRRGSWAVAHAVARARPCVRPGRQNFVT